MSDATYAGAVIMEVNGRDIDGTEIDWANITKAKITIYPINKEERRVSYLDCFTTECSEQYEADNEAKIDIEMIALHKIWE